MPTNPAMPRPRKEIVYEVVEHDGGWAYKVGDTFSEAFETREDAIDAAKRAAAEQAVPGPTEAIEFEDEAGRWHTELSDGEDRPEAHVEGVETPARTARPRRTARH
jgi:hypothetical protein